MAVARENLCVTEGSHVQQGGFFPEKASNAPEKGEKGRDAL